MEWLTWAPLGAAVLHISEEFVLPGGFTAWYRRYRVDASKVTPRFLIVVNAALLLGCVQVALLGRTAPGIFYWMVISAALAANGIWHIRASVKSHAYSPGVVTGTIIYVPLAIYGFCVFVRSGEASPGAALAAGIIGGSYPFWSARYHGVKPRAKDTQSAQ